ncbi:unnamed protein product, partial [Polarella glacialis]
ELTSLGGNSVSAVQGSFNGRNILTFQGHPEFTTAVTAAIVDLLEQKGVGVNALAKGHGSVEEIRGQSSEVSIHRPVHSDLIGKCVLNFLTPSTQ